MADEYDMVDRSDEYEAYDASDRWWEDDEADAPVHMCPPEGSSFTPCCGKTPFEVGRHHRITLNPELVTCHA